MNASLNASAFHIRFDYLFDVGRSLAFPCDAQGHVDFDSMSDRARANYLYARAMVGREYASPAVQPRPGSLDAM
jgi:hypothetical protein